MSDKEVWGPVHDPDEPCQTSDRKPISIGMTVIDYDRRRATVIEHPWEFDHGTYDPVCWSQAGHQGHWWRTDTGLFDGSRMSTRGV